MIKSIFLIFFRKVKKSDIYVLINLIGLGVGITACLLIFLYVSDELRFDRHHEHARQTYRLLMVNPNTGGESAIHPGVMYSHVKDQITGVEHIARVFVLPSIVLNPGDNPMSENGLMAADPSILNIFSFNFLEGDPATALNDPHDILLTPEAAERYFGDRNPIGQVLLLENEFTFVVSGLIEAPPAQSHLHFTMLTNTGFMETINPSSLTSWNNHAMNFYYTLEPDADPALVADLTRSIVWDAHESYKDRVAYRLQPLLDIRLYSNHIEWDYAHTGNVTVVLIFSAIAILVLVLACFNFINLSIATSLRRAREIGIKKVLGVSRKQLMLQFIAETFIITLFAMLLALLLAEIFLPALNNLTGKSLSVRLLSDPLLKYMLLSLLILVSLIAGGYPAFVMSRFKAINAMKGAEVITNIKGLRNKKYQFRTRQLLMLIQFAVSIALIVSSLAIFWQMRFLMNRDPGYEKESLIAIKNPFDEHAPSRARYLKEQLAQHADVVSVSLAHNIPPVTPNNYSHISFEPNNGGQRFHSALISVDADYFTTLKSQIVTGRDFLTTMATDASLAVIINETTATRLGAEDPVGITLQGFYDNQPRQVIGVVKDIHFSSMHESVGPMVFFISEDDYPFNWFNILVRYDKGAAASTIGFLNGIWEDEAAEWPLQYQFVDEQFREHYEDDRRTMIIVASFAGLAVILSLLGLLGLAVYVAATRKKEIGIRKVLGASVNKITSMITGEFGIMVIASNLLAWPAAFIFVNRWLDNFAYRIDINWFAFLVPSLVVYLFAVITVGLIVYRAANMNPVYTLQNAD